MKKIIYLSIFCTIVSAQGLELEGKKITPKKSTAPMKQLVDDNIAATIILDSKKSILRWKGGLKFVNNDHTGTLKIKQGRLLINQDKNFTRGKIQVNMMSMKNTDMEPGKGERLVGHLRGDDFFHVDLFPTATLDIQTSKIMGKTSSDLYKVKIEGNLTIKGVKKPITFDAEIDLDSPIKKATGTIIFNRADFGIQYRSEMHMGNPDSFWNQLRSVRDTTKDRVIRDEIEVEFEIFSIAGMLRK